MKPVGGKKSDKAKYLIPIIVGSVLILLQVTICINNTKYGTNSWQQPGFMQGKLLWYDLIGLPLELIAGVGGIVLLIIGMRRFLKRRK